MLKRLELLSPTSCLNKAGSNEPVFVLRAKDPLAAATIRHWATMAETVHEDFKIAEARVCAAEMDEYRRENFEARRVFDTEAVPAKPSDF